MIQRAKGDNLFVWDADSRRFRGGDGRYVSQTKIKAIKNQVIRAEKKRATELAGRAQKGELNIDLFVRQFRALTKQTTVMEYMLGRGGRNAMTQADHGRIGRLLRDQYQYINRFAADIESGKLTLDQATSRANMYIDSTRSAYERGYAAAWDVRLPEYPTMHNHCECSWSISEHGRGANREIHAYWRVNSANPCAVCVDLRDRYNPHKVPKPI